MEGLDLEEHMLRGDEKEEEEEEKQREDEKSDPFEVVQDFRPSGPPWNGKYSFPI